MSFFGLTARSTFCLATLLAVGTPSLLQGAEVSRDEAKEKSSEEATAPTKKLWESDPWTKPKLMVGDDAPAIDIEHWIQDGKGAFKHITEFESGKVYVVEFWATWCGPCVASIPHLSELQEKFAKQGVQIISVSDESKGDVKKFLKLALPENDKQTFADVTAVYCLTTDPDRSVYEAYMDAALRNGIPNAFIVGKEGKIEWIGHPMEMDDALPAVVDGSWDRKAFKAKFDAEQRLEGARNQVLMKAESDIEEAEAMIDDLIATAPLMKTPRPPPKACVQRSASRPSTSMSSQINKRRPSCSRSLSNKERVSRST
jgi:thiol-disulfide isomerase/thioredoxin